MTENDRGNSEEKAEKFMQVKTESRTGLAGEIKIVPAWAWVLAGMVFVAAQVFFNVAMARHGSPPPAWARPILGLLAGIGGGAYLLLIGYVNRDSKRRGMSPVLWTLVAVLIPNALGILLYFVLRQPLQSACPQCGNAVQSGFNFCPRCSCKLSPSCPQCQRLVGANDVYCPYCGTSLPNPAAAESTMPAKLPGSE
jgi:RNA polymerase subunit RPABC4/transcription elongation factor Spt4